MGSSLFTRSDSAYPATQMFGAQAGAKSTGTAPSNGTQDVSSQHIIITGIVLIALAYCGWHYVMTH